MKLKVWVELGTGYKEQVIDIPDEEVVHLSDANLQALIGEHLAIFVHNAVTVGYDIGDEEGCISPEIPVDST